MSSAISIGMTMRITSAQHGGFVVTDGCYDHNNLLFAGSLTDCLEFMRSKLAQASHD